jgi:hippurate hydrolase
MPIPNSIAAMADDLTEWRRDLHRHPELGYQETRTAGVVAERLRSFGFDVVEEGVGGTGVVGVLHGAEGPGDANHSILLRADMDALPIHEATGAEYASSHPGVMHACGHDGHTTMLLGAARHLASNRNFNGSAIFVFQPAEEGGAGARAMIDDGLFDRHGCRAVFGMHNWPTLPEGAFAIRPGPVMAIADELKIQVDGKGGHAAIPHQAHDPVVAASALVLALQSIISRRINPLQPVVLSVTTIQGGDAFNVIPDTVNLGGTIRSFDAQTHAQVLDEVRHTCNQIAAAHHVTVTAEFGADPYPATINDATEAAFAKSVLTDLVGADRVDGQLGPFMVGEDFAYFANEKPGAFVFIGNGDTVPLHNARYDFNDDIAALGVSYWVSLVEKALPRVP